MIKLSELMQSGLQKVLKLNPSIGKIVEGKIILNKVPIGFAPHDMNLLHGALK